MADIIVPPPPPLSGLPKWQLLASKWVHRLLYVLLFVIPLLGWLNASYRGFTVDVVHPRKMSTSAPGSDLMVSQAPPQMRIFVGVVGSS